MWKLYYQGSVGGQALVGLPVIKRLCERRAVKLWPFETGWKPLTPSDLEGTDALFAEVYPSLYGGKAQQGVSKDEAQVRASVERIHALDEKGQLAPLFGPAKDDPRRDAVEREEGWILGAPF